jgi:VWFA-related protein
MNPKTWRMFGLLGLAALALGAQEPPPAPAASSFGASVDVRVVNVEAVITDAKGKRVRGLSAGDLKLEVDGREVPIEYFAEIAEGQSVPAAPAVTAEGAPPAAAPSPAPQGRSFLVFIDEAFAVANQRDTVLEALERDLKLLGPEDRMAIVAFGGVKIGGSRIDVLSGWTGDTQALAAALRAARKRPASGNDVMATRRRMENDRELVSEALAANSVTGTDTDPYENDYAGARGLDSVAPSTDGGEGRLESWLYKLSRAAVTAMSGMAPPSGRRTLLLLSGGWPGPGFHIPLAVAANRLGYTIYPVDVQGVDMLTAVNDASHPYPGIGLSDGFISSGWERTTEAGMEFLARVTGGRAILNSARLSALGRVVEDTGSYYWLGFTPRWKGDDRHHRIEIKAGKGLEVRSRKGFTDFSRSTESSLAMQSILLLGGAAKDKRLSVEVGTPKIKGRQLELPVTVAIPVADLTPIEQWGGWRVEAILGTAVVDSGGSFSNFTETSMRVTLPKQPAPADLARHRMTLKLRRAKQRLVFIMRDPLGGTTLWGETEVNP